MLTVPLNNYWVRSGTVISPGITGDDVSTTGTGIFGALTIDSTLTLSSGLIEDSSGTISLGATALLTTGSITGDVLVLTNNISTITYGDAGVTDELQLIGRGTAVNTFRLTNAAGSNQMNLLLSVISAAWTTTNTLSFASGTESIQFNALTAGKQIGLDSPTINLSASSSVNIDADSVPLTFGISQDAQIQYVDGVGLRITDTTTGLITLDDDLLTTGLGTFGQIVDSGLTASLGVYTNASKQLTSTPPTSGVLGYWSRAGTVISTATSGDDITTSGDLTANQLTLTNSNSEIVFGDGGTTDTLTLSGGGTVSTTFHFNTPLNSLSLIITVSGSFWTTNGLLSLVSNVNSIFLQASTAGKKIELDTPLVLVRHVLDVQEEIHIKSDNTKMTWGVSADAFIEYVDGIGMSIKDDTTASILLDGKIFNPTDDGGFHTGVNDSFRMSALGDIGILSSAGDLFISTLSGILTFQTDAVTTTAPFASGATTTTGAATIGDGGSTNYLEISATGDVVFHGSGGLAYAEISVVSNAVETTIASAGAFVQVTIFNTDGASNNATPDHTNDHITITKAGHYLITCSITLQSIGGAGSTAEIEVQKNNGTARIGCLHADRTLAGGGAEAGAITITGIGDLAVNDTVEVWIKNENNTQNYIVEDICLSLVQLGGT